MNLLGPYKYVVDFLVIAALVAAAALAIHKYNDHQQSIGEARVQAQWDKQKAADAAATARAVAEAADKSKALQTAMDTQRSQSNAQLAALNSTLATAVAGLRDRPARPSASDLSEHPSVGTGCTGAGLYRPDAEFLTREASRAQQLAIRLEQCYVAYDAARQAVNK